MMQSYSQYDTSSSSNTSSNAYRCPSSTNVFPDEEYALNGGGRYTVCTTSKSAANILVHGTTSRSNRVCIYPAQVIDEQHVYVKPDTSTGLPWHQCSEISDLGVPASFPNINYNAVFIVEGPDESAMTSCLMGGNYFACPEYSFGQFR
jgi:hypothetical protein